MKIIIGRVHMCICLTIALLVSQVILGVFISIVAFKTLNMRGLIITGFLLAILFYVKDFYDIWCIATKRKPLGPSWSNHSLVTLGYVFASLCLTSSKRRIEQWDSLKRILMILIILLLNVVLDTIQDQIHFMLR